MYVSVFYGVFHFATYTLIHVTCIIILPSSSSSTLSGTLNLSLCITKLLYKARVHQYAHSLLFNGISSSSSLLSPIVRPSSHSLRLRRTACRAIGLKNNAQHTHTRCVLFHYRLFFRHCSTLQTSINAH